jgi:hypothetical protein
MIFGYISRYKGITKPGLIRVWSGVFDTPGFAGPGFASLGHGCRCSDNVIEVDESTQ